MGLRTYISQLYARAARKLSAFERDAAIAEKYLGVQLTREQFDTCKAAHGGQTLYAAFGSDSQIYNKYYGLGIPMQDSAQELRYSLLRHFSNAGVVFDIETPGANDRLFNRLFSTVQRHITLNENPRWAAKIPAPYCASPRLAKAANAILKLNGLPTPSAS